MQSELKPCAYCGSSDLAVVELLSRGLRIECEGCGAYSPVIKDGPALMAAWNARASDAEITRLTEALRAAEKLLAEIKCVSDVIMAPICAASGRYIYDWADCPDMIEELYSEDVCIPAKAFHDLYMATNYDIVVLAQALAGAKP